MALLLVLLWLLATAVLVTSKGVMLLQQGQQQTFAYALEEMPTAPLEDHVLDILELEEPPSTFIRRKRNDRVAEFMAQLFHELQDDVESTETNELAGSEDWSSADRIVSFTPTDAQFSSGLTVVTFHRDDLPNLSPSHLIAAQLRIFLPSEMTIAKVFVMSNRTGTPILLDSTIATSRETTVGLNVTEVVAEWMEGTSKPTLLIGIDSGVNELSTPTEVESFVVASFKDDLDFIALPRTRTRRAASPSPQATNTMEKKSSRVNPFLASRSEDIDGCHVQSLYLNFADIGWREWVIAPEGYSTNYCAGACASDSPMHSKMNATNHAIVQTLVHLVDPRRAEEAKCAPIQLSPAKILFIDNHGNVVMRRYQDMTVQECGCL